jgi:FkbM family methyltransferase
MNNFNFFDENGKKINHCLIERPEQELANIFIDSDDIVLELGARYGTVSCIINNKLSNKNNQVSVEPDQRVWAALENNMKINNCNFNIIQGFISKKKLCLTEINSYGGYGTTAEIDNASNIPSYTLEEIEEKYNLNFNVLVADCEGFLEQFLEENPKLYKNLKMIIFEADYPNKCNYNLIHNNLKINNFIPVIEGFQNVYIKQ